MSMTTLLEVFEFAREKTLAFVETLSKLPDPQQALSWRPAPGRAHIAWQLMHLAATDDRHVHLRMQGGQPQRPDYVQRFAGGSTPDDTIPTLEEVRAYLTEQRLEITAHWRKVPDSALDTKPNEQAPWTYRQWVKMLTFHEAHHQGQAHLTLNLFKAANGIA